MALIPLGGGYKTHLLRIMSEPLEEERSSDIRARFEGPWIMPPSRFDVPGDRPDRAPGEKMRGDERYAAFPLDMRPAGQGGGCTGEFRLAIGETYVVLRDAYGRPYFGGPWYAPGGGLPIEAKFAEARITLNAPALVRIAGPDDPYLVRLRAVLNQAR